MSHSAEIDSAREPWNAEAHQARLDKYGSTLDRWNVNHVAARIADYPELIEAVDALRRTRVTPPPRVGEVVTVTGVVRTVETLFPDGHYRIELDTDQYARVTPPGVSDE